LFFQALTARLTNNLAANDLFGANATSLITSSFDSTFHIYKKNKKSDLYLNAYKRLFMLEITS
jgi:hypothetical protein